MSDRTTCIIAAMFALAGSGTPFAADQGNVYLVDPTLSPSLETALLDGVDAGSPHVLSGFNGGLVIYQQDSGRPEDASLAVIQVGPTSGDDFLYLPSPGSSTDGFASVMAYYHMAKSRAAFQALGVDVTSWPLAVVVNARVDGQPLDRMFFSVVPQTGLWTQAVFVGHGASRDLDHDGTLFARGFARYAIRNAFGFSAGRYAVTPNGQDMFAAAIEEGAADYFAGSFLGTSTIGAYGLGPDAVDLNSPGRSCALIQGDARDASIVSSLAWATRDVVSSETADRMLLDALALLPMDAPLDEFAAAYDNAFQQAFDMTDIDAMQLASLRALLTDSGLATCGRLVSVGRAAPIERPIAGLQAIASERIGTDCDSLRSSGASIVQPAKYVVTALPSDLALTLTVNVGDGLSGSGVWRAFVRAGLPVTFEGSGDAPQPLEFDASVQSTFGAAANIVLTPGSTPALAPGAIYHVAIMHTACPAVTSSLSVSAESQPAVFADGFEGD